MTDVHLTLIMSMLLRITSGGIVVSKGFTGWLLEHWRFALHCIARELSGCFDRNEEGIHEAVFIGSPGNAESKRQGTSRVHGHNLHIVAIVAAALVPKMGGRTEFFKWSEAKVVAGTIATAIRTYVAEKGADFSRNPSLTELGLTADDLNGTYFTEKNYRWLILKHDPLAYRVVAIAPKSISRPRLITLDQTGTFTASYP